MGGTKTVEEKVIRIIAKVLNYESGEIGPEYELVKDLGADSLELVNIMYDIEDAFRIDIPDDVIPGLLKVKDIICFVAETKGFENAKEDSSGLEMAVL